MSVFASARGKPYISQAIGYLFSSTNDSTHYEYYFCTRPNTKTFFLLHETFVLPEIENLQKLDTPVGGWSWEASVALKFHRATIWVYKKVHPDMSGPSKGLHGKKWREKASIVELQR